MDTDVVELILADHRRFEDLFRELRSSEGDRRTALAELAGLLVAHAEAEETQVYPALRRLGAADGEEVEHGSEEHDEGHRALLALLEVGEPGGSGWDEALEELSGAITHHLDEEERTLLNDARERLTRDRRGALGAEFARMRARLLDSGCGGVEQVRELVRRAGS
ncbi:hemerythrin domain-containing protein [Saccharopolyspora cebuensis]|uniref:Hemerythrin domain-containing protein n=1 Tax=Saccharopolyspora cebuensis TaxID=418759 RepID=A0ABV4CJG6_9PSEU